MPGPMAAPPAGSINPRREPVSTAPHMADDNSSHKLSSLNVLFKILYLLIINTITRMTWPTGALRKTSGQRPRRAAAGYRFLHRCPGITPCRHRLTPEIRRTGQHMAGHPSGQIACRNGSYVGLPPKFGHADADSLTQDSVSTLFRSAAGASCGRTVIW
jgi:hypothetical protein